MQVNGEAQLPGTGRIVWLVSYPKSGNTWLRIVLGHLLGTATPDGQINELAIQDGIASERSDFDNIVGVNAADLPDDQVECLRPRVYEWLSREAQDRLFIKVHDAYTPTPRGEPMFPLQATFGVVHIVRNPLDVAVSWAHHFGVSQDRAVQELCDERRTLGAHGSRLNEQLPQRLLDWSGHAASWLAAPLSRITVRYEDMLASPHAIFGNVARFCGIEATADAIDQAVQASRFDRLSSLESAGRFHETLLKTNRFFRKGRAGDWKDALSPDQVAAIVARHEAMMLRLGYGAEVAEATGRTVAGIHDDQRPMHANDAR